MNPEFTKKFKIVNLDPVSPTFCAAKWLDATIWLSSGYSTSCHHNPLYKIDLEELKTNPSALHNTAQKRLDRIEMLEGKQPSGCQYCWKIENETNSFSDRVYKSFGIGDNNIKELIEKGLTDPSPQLKTLEISFDNVCNMACIYCNQSFSNKWTNDIKKNGPYIKIHSDQNYSAPIQHLPEEEVQQYVDAFWKWWPELKKNLKWFRITGGEPLLNDNTWKIIEDLSTDGSSLQLMINTNLNHKPNIIEKLLEYKKLYPNIMLFTSLESMGTHAEYARDGLDFELWKANLTRLLEEDTKIHIMTTVNILSLDSITNFYEYVAELQAQGKNVSVDCNFMRYPRFLSISNLSQELKNYYLDKIETWYKTNSYKIKEKHQVEKLIEYMKNVEHPDQYSELYDKDLLRQELRNFLIQFDARRNKSFESTFDEKLVRWINGK
jgi:organic radical activating enzyme